MKCLKSYFIIFLFLFIIFVVLLLYFLSLFVNTRENMENSSQQGTIILLGDSVFKNEDYVQNDKSVYSLLTKQTGRKVYNYAVNESTILDVYNQINQIPIDLNSENTTIFLSIGGNDIIEKFVERENMNNGTNTNTTLDAMFSAYTKIVKSIQTKMNKSRIVLLDVYYPQSMKLKPYVPIIRMWNTKVENYVNDFSSSNKIQNVDINVLKISEIMTQPTDLVFEIEPSETGGEKVAKSILNA